MSRFDDEAPAEGRELPKDLEAEKAVLGSVLLHSKYLHAALEFVKPADFFREAHRLIFEAAIRIVEKGGEADGITIRSHLAQAGHLEKVGGMAYIASLVDGLPHSSNVEHYARLVREKALRRALVFAAGEIAALAHEDEETRKVIDRAEHLIFQISQGGQEDEGLVHIGDILAKEALPLLEKWSQSREGVSGLATGFIDLDEATSGLQPGELVILGGRPAMGKTSIALNIARNVGLAGKTAAVFSLEMKRTELAIRELAGEAHIDNARVRRGHLGERDWTKLAEAIGRLSGAKLFIDESADISVWEMRSKCRRLKAEHGLDLVLIDYVQLMAGDPKAENRQQAISTISRSLKQMAKSLGVPVVALSQLSRDCEKRPDHRPILADLRESGSLEQDADIVGFIYRESVYNETPENLRKAEIILAKQRNNPIGTVHLAWIPEETRFANAAPEYRQDTRQLPLGDR